MEETIQRHLYFSFPSNIRSTSTEWQIVGGTIVDQYEATRSFLLPAQLRTVNQPRSTGQKTSQAKKYYGFTRVGPGTFWKYRGNGSGILQSFWKSTAVKKNKNEERYCSICLETLLFRALKGGVAKDDPERGPVGRQLPQQTHRRESHSTIVFLLLGRM